MKTEDLTERQAGRARLWLWRLSRRNESYGSAGYGNAGRRTETSGGRLASSQSKIVDFWWEVDDAIKECVRNKGENSVSSIGFRYQSGMLFIDLPSGRSLVYVKPRIEENDFGGESITYMGVGANKKWERIESYGPKFVENIVQAVARNC